jgi:phosphatidate cytidylyltransferase
MSKEFIVRTLSGALIVIATLALALHPIVFLIGYSVAMALMMHEYYDMSLGKGKYKIKRAFATISSIVSLWMIMAINTDVLNSNYIYIPVLLLIMIFSLLLFEKDERVVRRSEHLIFPLLYITIPMIAGAHIAFDANNQFKPIYFILTMLMVWANDVGAYIFGISFGQKPNSKKLFPAVSPKKSWAGAIGGTFTVAIVALFYHLLNLVDSWLILVIMTLIVSTFGVIGDLFESLIKRSYGVKDSGNTIPGHGGFLDRFDAALFVMPLITLILKLFSVI